MSALYDVAGFEFQWLSRTSVKTQVSPDARVTFLANLSGREFMQGEHACAGMNAHGALRLLIPMLRDNKSAPVLALFALVYRNRHRGVILGINELDGQTFALGKLFLW